MLSWTLQSKYQNFYLSKMNIFNELLRSGQNTMTNMIKNNLGYTGNNAKQQKLRGQLHACTYSDDKKFVIEKAIKQVFHVYPNFDTDILSFKQGNVQKRFMQLKAILQIQVRGKVCKVDFNMMIPANFPQKPPYVRIINRNPDFIVDDFYRPLQSPTDNKSYILNQRLNEIKNWDQTKSIVNVIIECYDLLRNRFPFSKSGNKSTVQNNGQFVSPWSQFNNPQQMGFNNGGYQGNYNQGYQQQQNYGQLGYNNPNYNMAQLGQNYMGAQKNQPPVPFNMNVNQIIANGQKFAVESKKTLDKLKVQHVKALQSVQTLDTLKYSIQSEEAFLRKENVQMNNFLQANQNTQSTESLVNLVRPQDELSQQILDLMSSIKSREDCTDELELKFNEGAITFDDFLRHVRKNEEMKFQQKVLLAKCVSVSRKY